MNAEAIAPRLPKTIPEMGRVLVVMECSIPAANQLKLGRSGMRPASAIGEASADAGLHMHSCRPQEATLRNVRSLKHTEIRPSDDISYVIKIKRTHLYPLRFYVQYFHFTLIR